MNALINNLDQFAIITTKTNDPFKKSHRVLSNDDKTFVKFEKTLSRLFFFYTTKFSEYDQVNFKKNKIRMVVLVLVKVASTILLIRCILNVLWPSKQIRDLTCNAYHYLADPFLMNLTFFAGSLTGNMGIGLANQLFDMTGNNMLFRYLNKIKCRTLDYPLNNKHRNKLNLYLNIISLYLATQFVPSWLICSVFYSMPTIIGYFDPALNFSIIGI